jgi:hypothetical protein
MSATQLKMSLHNTHPIMYLNTVFLLRQSGRAKLRFVCFVRLTRDKAKP